MLFDARLDRLGVEHDLGRALHANSQSAALVDMRSRLTAVQATEDGIGIRTFEGPDLDPAARTTIWPGSYLDERGRMRTASALDAARLRDTVMLAFTNHSALQVAVYDPFAGEVLAEPLDVEPTPAHSSPAIAGDDKTGVAGVCFADGEFPPPPRNPSSIRFVAVGPDGRPIGEPVTIASDLSYVAACTVGVSAPGEFIVLFWNAAAESPRHSILAARVRLRL